MGDPYFGKVRGRTSATATTATSGGVSATIAAPSNAVLQYATTGIQVSGDKACLVTIESPASTVLWRKRFAAAFTMSESFAPGTLKGAQGAALLVKASDSTSNVEANIQALLV